MDLNFPRCEICLLCFVLFSPFLLSSMGRAFSNPFVFLPLPLFFFFFFFFFFFLSIHSSTFYAWEEIPPPAKVVNVLQREYHFVRLAFLPFFLYNIERLIHFYSSIFRRLVICLFVLLKSIAVSHSSNSSIFFPPSQSS